MVRLGERTSVSYSLSTETRSRNTAFTASCHAHTERGKYDRGRTSAVSTSAGKCGPPSGKRRPRATRVFATARTRMGLWKFYPPDLYAAVNHGSYRIQP